MREDRRTSTPEDAGLYERARGGGFGPPEDRPTRQEAEQDAVLDRREAEWARHEQALARARGEYVPSVSMQLQTSLLKITLAQKGWLGEVTPHREGVWMLTGGDLTAASVAVDENRYEVRASDGVLWLKGDPATLNPFAMPPA